LGGFTFGSAASAGEVEKIDAKSATVTAMPIVRFISFPLNSSWWLTRDVENHSIYFANLISDPR
jgi:hypothetical protein